nr:ABC transporter ATP-binding protein [uncultured Cohaesibacter sp.]
MINFINVEKHYKTPGGGRKDIIKTLNMRFPKRNIALMGANGAGKSTMLRLISGAELPDKGKIVREVGVSFPLGFSGSFAGALSGIENARFVARIYGKDTDEVLDYVEEFAQLGDHFRAPVNTYSSGMRARLSFGVSLAIDFDCYLVDEITAVGDERFKNKSKKAFMEKLQRSNIIMVSHSTPTLRDYCDMGIILRDGNAMVFEDLEDAIKDHDAYMKR